MSNEKCLYLQTQLDTYKLLSDMASRQTQDETHATNVDEALARIQVVHSRCTLLGLFISFYLLLVSISY